MVLRESPFPNRPLAALDALAQGLLCPGFWALNQLLDLQPTTAPRARGRGCCGCTGRALGGLACAALLLLSLPLTALGLLLWLPVQAARRPFAYHHHATTTAPVSWDLRQRRGFTFVSANLCLLPSGLAKFSNLGQTLERAAFAAQQLVPEPPGAHDSLIPRPRGEAGPWHYGSVVVDMEGAAGERAVAKLLPADASRRFPAELSERFPAHADFLCLQEVYDAGAAARLRQRLAKSFPYIVYDVGARGLQGCGLKLFGSGLFLASRYPLLAVQYHCYPNGAREDALSAKGLLSVQVTAAPSPGTPLPLLPPPLPGGERGWAPCDEPNQSHEIFKLYRDPCRVGPKQDEPWAMGTLLDYLKIYEEPVLGTRGEGGGDGPGHCGSPEGHRCPQGGRWGGGRGKRDAPEVESFSFITQMASRSDHLPVALRLAVSPTAP
uniref:sphingomyelin phosphodiesterase n=1 Tax=Anas zonorhyncha TaxID=75864 RepID=A0A8B9VMW0_9AVES